MGKDDSSMIVNISSLSLDQDEVINQVKFTNDRFIPPSSELEYSVIDNLSDDEPNNSERYEHNTLANLNNCQSI